MFSSSEAIALLKVIAQQQEFIQGLQVQLEAVVASLQPDPAPETIDDSKAS